MTFENVISVCNSADIQTWKAASPRIIERISSKNYTLITPNSDKIDFANCTPSEYNVIPEEDYITPEFRKLLHQKTEASRVGKTRLGWYLQQFLKLSALQQTSAKGLGLIWDADTVPLKNLSFEKEGKILFYKGVEFHQPYFSAIQTLLGLQKRNSFSYIAQCFPCKGSWIGNLLKTIEINTQKYWMEGIADSIDFDESSGFSEYETIGTFLESQYPQEISILNNRWSRYGNGLIGSIDNLWLFETVLKARYDFVSFEKWNEPYSKYPGRKLRRRLKKSQPKRPSLHINS